MEDATIKLSKITGKAMFKFDDDEPNQIAEIKDYGKFSFEMNQKDPDGNIVPEHTYLQFTSKEGKVLKLYIESVDERQD